MGNQKGDKKYFKEPGREPPRVEGCLIHPYLKAKEFFETGPMGMFQGVDYGLCEECLKTLSLYPPFQKYINREIEERIRELTTH